jgi:hypothetical protein
MTEYSLDPATDLPQLEENQRWKVSATTYRPLGRYTQSRGAFRISLQTRGWLGIWRSVRSGYVYDHFGSSVPSFDLSTQAIRVSAHRLLDTQKSYEAKLTWKREQLNLLGNYPPKQL